jgi:hypothetical protein
VRGLRQKRIAWKKGVLSSRRRAESVARTACSEARLISDVLSRQTKDDRKINAHTMHEREDALGR